MAHQEEESKNGHANGGYVNGNNDIDAWSNEDGYGSFGSKQKRKYDLMQGMMLFISQFRGLMTKRFIYTYRRPILYIIMMLVPIGMALFNVLSLNSVQTSRVNYKAMEFTLDDYVNPITYYRTDGMSTGFGDHFKDTIQYGTVEKVDNLTEAILNQTSGHANLAKYQDQYIIAAEFFEDEISLLIPWKGKIASGVFNSVPIHAKPLAQMHISNALLGEFEKDEAVKHKISVTTHPLPDDKSSQFESVVNGDGTLLTFAYGTVFPIGLSILVSSFIIFPLNERTTNAKQVQIMTGLNPVIFWISNLLWDNFLYLISSLTMVILVVNLDESKVFSTYGGPGVFVLMIIFLGMFGIPFSYVISFFFSTAAGGFSFLIIFNVLAGSIAPLAVFLLRQFGDQDGASAGLGIASDVVRWIFNIFPIFPFTRSLMAIITVQESNNRCENKIDRDTLTYACQTFKKFPMLAEQGLAKDYAECCTVDLVGTENAFCDIKIQGIETIPCHQIQSFFTWDRFKGINTDITVMAVDGLILFALLVLIEMKYLSKLINWIRNANPSRVMPDQPKLDEDVLAEQARVKGFEGHDILRVFDLRKVFGTFHAVKGLSFGVKPGECFGLLGINGAGKTTSFRMLTGDEIPSTGVASLLGNRLKGDRSKFLQQIGYCPQFDSIIPELTGKELLTLMCRVRGVPNSCVESEVQRWTDFLEIQQYIHRESGSYSGGNKRKLNVAMSLVGEPPIVFLDEPSTGVDPVARRNLWTIIQRIQRNGQSVVLTSHSMDECEFLCDRMGIMVNGQFQCFGSVSHLKNKFAQGFSIQLNLNIDELMSNKDFESIHRIEEALISAMNTNFPQSSVKDRHMGYLQFSVENPNIPLHVLFGKMENIRRENTSIEEYSIRETTLEQVFLSFARQQQTTL